MDKQLGKPPDFDLIDRWKARCEALERAIKGIDAACSLCNKNADCTKNGPAKACTFDYYNRSAWEFDYDRFKAEENGGITWRD